VAPTVAAATVAAGVTGPAAPPSPAEPSVGAAEAARPRQVAAEAPVEPVAAPARPKAPPTRAGAIVGTGARRRPRGLIIGTLVVVGILVAGGVAAAFYLPTATIEVEPRPEPIGPVQLTVSADPVATTVDTAGGVVPATTVDFPVTTTQTFEATGTRVEATRATGTVTFSSINTIGPVAVASGTRVSTLGGVVFATTKDVVVPKATVALPSIKPGTVSVAVRATKTGPDGNVEAGEITQVPDILSTQQVSVNNGEPTSGGSRTEFPQVTQKDVDAAVKALEVEVTRMFADAVATGEGVPEGQTLFPATAALGPIAYDPDPASLVNDEVETFDLAANATGTATAVDIAQVRAIAEDRLRSGVAAGAQLVPGSVVVDIGDPTISGSVVSFPVTASASQVRSLDADALEAEILGLPVDEAETILERHGTVTITVWPDWMTTIPTLEQRVTVTVVGGVMPSAAPSSVPS
jgi:hypothetical protein